MAKREDGFSLVELVVAMTVTLIISGAVLQLVTAGQTAFRREPELADRQQNIRAGMDIIAQDVYQAGYGVPQFAQVFTDSLNGIGPMGSGGAATDELEIVRSTDCPYLTICDINGTQLTTREGIGACYRLPSLVLLANDSLWAPLWAEKPGAGANAACAGGGGPMNGHLAFPAGQDSLNPPGGPVGTGADKPFPPTNPPTYIMVGQIVRYRINLDADNIPNLERSALGGVNDPETGASSWRIIARGVEDLQVQYLKAGTTWLDTPGATMCGVMPCTSPTPADLNTLVRRVRIQLSARATGGGQLTGESASVVGTAVRGQLVTEIMPRPVSATLGLYRGEL